jgi:hypothetical protein
VVRGWRTCSTARIPERAGQGRQARERRHRLGPRSGRRNMPAALPTRAGRPAPVRSGKS